MHPSTSEEQQALRATVRSLFADHADLEAVQRSVEEAPRVDQDLWRRLVDQIGVQGLMIPEQHGGAGYGVAELGVVLEEAGYALLTAPLLSTCVLTTGVLLACDDRGVADPLLAAVAGGATGAVALTDGATPVVATPVGDGRWTLSGEKRHALHGHLADLLITTAGTDSGPGLFLVEEGIPDITAAVNNPLDPTRPTAHVSFSATPARFLGPAGNVLGQVGDLACIAIALESVGGARRCLDMAVDYVKVREQFGRPLGSFQAVKHRCSDMFVDTESARALAQEAAHAAAVGSADVAVLAPLVKAACTDAFFRTAATTLQLHGGIGFTWDHPIHLFLKRAKASQLLFGSSVAHRDLLIERLPNGQLLR